MTSRRQIQQCLAPAAVVLEERILPAASLVSANQVNIDAGNGLSIGTSVFDVARDSTRQMSSDGRFVLFTTNASDIGPNLIGPGQHQGNIYVRDRQTGMSALVNVSVDGAGHGDAADPSMTPDGRYVVFTGASYDGQSVSPLVAGITFPVDAILGHQLYVRDLVTGTTSLVSVRPDGVGSVGNDDDVAFRSSISADGNRIVFVGGVADDLVAEDSNGYADVFVRDITTGTTTLISHNITGTNGGNGNSYFPTISADGTRITFLSDATDLTSLPDNNGEPDLFSYSFADGTITLLSVNLSGTESANAGVLPVYRMDDSGQKVALLSRSTDLMTGTGFDFFSVNLFLRDVTAETTTLISHAPNGDALGVVGTEFGLSRDGSTATFVGDGGFVAAAPDGVSRQIYLEDTSTGRISLVSHSSSGTPGNADSSRPTTSGNGRYVLYSSTASNLVKGVTLGQDSGGSLLTLFVYDKATGRTHAVATNSDETQTISTDGAFSGYYSISRDGSTIAFTSIEAGYGVADSNGLPDVYSIATPPSTTDLVVFDPATGRWKLGVSNGSGFTWTNGPKFNPASGWRTFTGDFNGDGLTDGLGITSTNSVFLARNNGNGTMTTVSAGSFANETLQYLMVGDFNGDGADDLIVQFATASTGLPGSWYTKSWNGSAFVNSFYGRWEATGWTGFVTGDVNLDGADDIIGFRDATDFDRTNITYGISNIIPGGSRRFVSQLAGALSGKTANVGWTSILVGDWDNDGRADIAARRNDGRFYYGTATGTPTANASLGANKLVPSTGPLFSPSAFTGSFLVGDFNGDGRDDILTRQSNNKNLWVALTNAAAPTSATVSAWGSWDDTKNWSGAAVGDFNGDGLDDYASVDLTASHAWVSLSTGTAFQAASDFGLINGPEALVGPLRISRGIVS